MNTDPLTILKIGLPFWAPPRTCLTKRAARLQIGFDRLASVENSKLSQLQKMQFG